MKILNISSVPVTYSGGTERVIFELSKEFSKKHKVTILQTNLYEERKKIKKYSKIGEINIITCKNDKFLGGFGYSKEFKNVLKKIWKAYDIIHIYGHGRFTSNFSLNFLKNKKPLVYSAHGFFHDKRHQVFKKIYNIYFKKVLKKVQPFCIALTEIEKQQYLKFGIKKEKITIIPGGITCQKLKIKNISKLKKEYFEGKEKDKIMLYVGRIHESKGLKYIIQAIKNLDIKFIIIGKDTGYKKELEKLIKKEQVGKKVKFLGRLNEKELKEMYNLCNFFILFSSWEGFGLTVIEAMSAGKPVIVSDKGALPLIVENGKTGFIVKYPNIKELNTKIKFFIKNTSLIKSMGKNAEKFSKQFNWKNITKKHLDIYNKLTK